MAKWIATTAAALAGAMAGIALSASADQFTAKGQSSGAGVTRAEFDRLKGEVQTLEGRVVALEHLSGHSGKAGKSAKDNWSGH